MTNQEQIMEALRTWSQLHTFIKQIWIISLTKSTIELVFKIVPYGGFDDKGQTWTNYGPNFLKELSRKSLLNLRVKVFRYNDPKFPNETEKANKSGIPIFLPPFQIVD